MDLRRRPWIAAATSSALLLASGCSGEDTPGPTEEVGWELVTRPDLTPPKIDLTPGDAAEAEGAADDDLVLLAVKDQKKGAPMNGPLIVDAEGDPVWIAPQGDTRWAYDLRVQEYEGEQVLTWWRGDTSWTGYGEGEFVVMDSSYEEIATVTTSGTRADFHDATLTDDGTALLISYPIVERDLSSLDGPVDGYIRDAVVQEVDVETGEVLFDWSASDHVPLTETDKELDPDGEENGERDEPFDPYHANSVTEDGDDALLVSARNTHAVYRVDRSTGEVEWTLGGKGSDFAMDEDAVFAWQHDAQRQEDGSITLFDNQAAPQIGDSSRGLTLEVDTEEDTASVVTEYLPPEGQDVSESQGNMQVLDDGTVLIGWGSMPTYSHHAADGELIEHAELAGGISYRAYRQPWVGSPSEPPKFVVADGRGHASWNGATEVDAWRFVAGSSRDTAEEVETVDAAGFEVSAAMPDAGYVGVEALDADGDVLATAEPGSWP